MRSRRKWSAMNQTGRPVVILYEHALLGEGISKYILAESGVEAAVVSALDLDAVESALAYDPAVVIFESVRLLQPVELSSLAPHALLIDVSKVISSGLPVSLGADELKMILHSVLDGIDSIPRPE